jgi:hypothetical protein
LEREKSLVAYLTEDWFRILTEPKHRGHENGQGLHFLWKEVQDSFRRWFTGHPKREDQAYERREKPVCRNPVPLVKQAAGCISTALAGCCKLGNKTIFEQLSIIEEFILSNLFGSEIKEKMRLKVLEYQKIFEAQSRLEILDYFGMSTEQIEEVIKAFWNGVLPQLE